jgi:hypothetical protein
MSKATERLSVTRKPSWIDRKLIHSEEWVTFYSLGYRDFQKNLKRVRFKNSLCASAYENGWLTAKLDKDN